jgi:hypothetical protein
MSRHFSLAFMFMVFVYALSIGVAPRPALAAKCDVNKCIDVCSKRNPQGGAGHVCTSYCLQKCQ